MVPQKIWLVTFPTHKYVEDVKQLARQHNLKIIDSRYRKDINLDLVEANPPKLTPKPKPKGKAAAE